MSGKARILLIDDERQLCAMLKRGLESKGTYEVTTAYSGEEGLEAAEAAEFDLVITDLKLPGIEGGVVLERLKARRPTLPVIFLSVYHDDDAALTPAKRARADGVVPKPIDHAQLYQAIEAALARRPRRPDEPSRGQAE